MPLRKRLFDIALALLLGALLAVPFMVLAAVCLALDGRPLFYGSERMRSPDRAFTLWKLRSMRPAAGDRGVSGGDKTDRITRMGRILRRSRLDEIPQIWNVLKGDMSFVGPRPPLREYVERFPETYAQVLVCRPGITGLASLIYHAHEEWWLARCTTAAETDAVYARICVPRKARLDLIYRANWSLRLDLWILWRTAAKLFGR